MKSDLKHSSGIGQKKLKLVIDSNTNVFVKSYGFVMSDLLKISTHVISNMSYLLMKVKCF
jgi:hypothetical protein